MNWNRTPKRLAFELPYSTLITPRTDRPTIGVRTSIPFWFGLLISTDPLQHKRVGAVEGDSGVGEFQLPVKGIAELDRR